MTTVAGAAGTSPASEAVYEIRVAGPVPDDALDTLKDLGDFSVRSAPVSTVLSRATLDQSDLLGFLDSLRAAGLEVVEVRRVHGLPDHGVADP